MQISERKGDETVKLKLKTEWACKFSVLIAHAQNFWSLMLTEDADSCVRARDTTARRRSVAAASLFRHVALVASYGCCLPNGYRNDERGNPLDCDIPWTHVPPAIKKIDLQMNNKQQST
jgi:hypothetical protein